MMSRKIFSALLALVFTTGCTAPIIKGDSAQNKKQLSFPKVGVPSTAKAGGLAALYSDYESRHVFQLTKPLHISVMLVNKIRVSTDEKLYESDIDGETVYCSEHNTYYDALTGPWAKACFKSTTPGKFSSVIYRPGAVWLSKAITPAADFISREVQDQRQVFPLKRELIFEGTQSGVLMFSERIYEKSLETPSRVKPLIASISSLPAKVSLDGMDINVLQADADALTFEVVTPWQ